MLHRTHLSSYPNGDDLFTGKHFWIAWKQICISFITIIEITIFLCLSKHKPKLSWAISVFYTSNVFRKAALSRVCVRHVHFTHRLGSTVRFYSPSHESLLRGGVAVPKMRSGYKTLLRRRQQQQTPDPRKGCRNNRSSLQMYTPTRALRQGAGTKGRKEGKTKTRESEGLLLQNRSALQAWPTVRPTGAERHKKKKGKNVLTKFFFYSCSKSTLSKHIKHRFNQTTFIRGLVYICSHLLWKFKCKTSSATL